MFSTVIGSEVVAFDQSHTDPATVAVKTWDLITNLPGSVPGCG